MTIRALIFCILFVPNYSQAQDDTPPNSSNSMQLSDQIDQQDASILRRHHPFYFVYGRPLSKLQLSFKVPVVRKVPVYFAYSQVMFWALEEDSKPFRDQTYNPEFFYRYSTDRWGALKSVDLSPWSHNSNGKRDADSRSYNRAYARFNFEHEYSRWVVRASVQGSYLDGFDPTNKDILDYIGPLSLGLTFIQLFDSWVDKSEFSLTASPGGKFANRWDRGGYQASLSFRLGGINIVPAFYLQYYHGYAETLLNYTEDVQQFRGGVIF